MWLLIVLALVDFGSSYSIEKCYGSYYDLPLLYTPPLFTESIYYKPRGEARKLVVSDGQTRDKRFSIVYGHLRMKDLTEQDDEGVLLFGKTDNVKLKIDDCQEPESSYYGFLFSWRVSSAAEYMEFSKMTSSGFAKPKVIWNRTDASIGWGTVTRDYFEISNLKQKHNGYYKFMSRKGGLIHWKRLEVKEFYKHLEYMAGEDLEMRFSVELPSLRRILFTHQGADYELTIERKYMDDRMELTQSYFYIRDLQYEDSGTYKFIDEDGFLAVHMELVVNEAQAPAWVYVVALVVIVLCVIFCCCCVKKCCCKKSSNKRNSPATEAPAPPVFYHNTTQPAQPLVPLLEREPRALTTDPPAYNAAVRNMNPPTSTQVAVPEGPGPTSTPAFSTSSDSDPKFEFKGMAFPSAPPLSSDTSIPNVYTSDKLNFL